jgi:RNA-directed DNA polymerase
MNTIEKILLKQNMTNAFDKVFQNKGGCGVDGMHLVDLKKHLHKTWSTTKKEIEAGSFLPNAILGIEIPKSNGKTRLLGVPTVHDRVIQQAVHQVIMPRFDEDFSHFSYGFRPGKSAHDAVKQALEYINDGFQSIVDIDLKQFFDEVNHDLLLELVYDKIKCTKTMALIRRFLRVPIQINGALIKRRKGVPQGGPLSPLLSNILLNVLDKELEKRGLRFVRYADDFSIYVKSDAAAKRVEKSITDFLNTKLRLIVNQDKSGIRRPTTFELLGYRFTSTYKKGEKGKYRLTVTDGAFKKLKKSIKAVTRKTIPMSFDERIRKLKSIQRGWINYFHLGGIKHRVRTIDKWVRSRLRYCIWHHWKNPERRRKNFIRLGLDHNRAYAYSRARRCGWFIAMSPIMGCTVTKARLEARGYMTLEEMYLKV